MSNQIVFFVILEYNAEEHLRICIDSVLNQTYRNVGIILVNDGSTDNFQKIIDEYKKSFQGKS